MGNTIKIVDEKEVVLGMVAYYQHSDTRCEMKRFYVRSTGCGHFLESIMGHAKASGYKEIVLDIIEPLQAAIHLYKKHSFVECEAYYQNSMDNNVI